MEKVLELYCLLLPQVVSLGGAAGALRSRLAARAPAVARRARAAPLPPALFDAFTKLCRLCTFFDHYHAENYDAAFEVRYMRLSLLMIRRSNTKNEAESVKTPLSMRRLGSYFPRGLNYALKPSQYH